MFWLHASSGPGDFGSVGLEGGVAYLALGFFILQPFFGLGLFSFLHFFFFFGFSNSGSCLLNHFHWDYFLCFSFLSLFLSSLFSILFSTVTAFII